MRLCVSSLMLLSVWLIYLPSAYAQSGEALATKKDRFVVVALDSSPTTEGVLNTLVGGLRTRGKVTITAPELERSLALLRVPAPTAEVHDKFAGYREPIISGIRDFFYIGEKEAIAQLVPVVSLGTAHMAKLAHDPKIAAEIYEAAAVVLRAYIIIKRKEDAVRWARMMGRIFPSVSPDVRTIPPEEGDYVRRAQQELGEQQQTFLTLQLGGAKGCQAYVNGMPAEPKPYAIDAGEGANYMLLMECPGEKETFVWRLPITPGKSMRVPLIAGEPLALNMQDASLATRDRIEQQLHFLRWWSGADVIVGVSRTALGGESLLMVRVEAGQPAQWSDGADEAALQRLLPRILPELGADALSALRPAPQVASAQAEAQDGPLWPWISLGTGIGLAAFGGFGLYYAASEEQRMDCSPSSRADKSGCSGVDAYGELSDAQLDRLESQIGAWRAVGWVGLGVGAALTGLGVWGLLSGDDGEQAARWQLAPTQGGALVQGTWRF